MRGVLDVGDAADAVRDAPRALEGLVFDEVVEGLAEDVRRLGVTHEIHREVDHVQQVDERTAAGEFLGGEPAAEARDAGTADPLRLGGVDLTDLTLLDILHHRLRLGTRAVVEVEHHVLTGLLGSGDDFLDFRGAERRRLLAEDVLAGVEALDGERSMELVRDDDADGVELLVGREHRVHGLVGVRDTPLRGGLLGGARRGIRDGDDLRARLLEAGGVVLEHAPCSDDAYFGCHECVRVRGDYLPWADLSKAASNATLLLGKASFLT